MTSTSELRQIANYHCGCGENPIWDEKRRKLFWADLDRGRLFEYDYESNTHKVFYSGDVGGFTLQADGSFLLFKTNKISMLNTQGSERVILDGIDDKMSRFNDVIADPEGRVFAGTVAEDGKSGGLFLLDLDGRIRCLFRGTGCSNGMAFSVDRKKFYWTCSTRKKIFVFDYHQATGDLSNEQIFLALAEGEGIPDGMTIDTEDCIWSARWEGHAVHRFDPQGNEIGQILLPVQNVTSVAFGGRELDELFITTAGGRDNADTPDGSLYQISAAVSGLLEFRSKISLG